MCEGERRENDFFYNLIEENARSFHSVFLAFSQSYMKNDLKKNKIVMTPLLIFFLGISTKFRMIKSILSNTISKGLPFHP